MAQLKLKKYPKKPRASASVAILENYLRKVKEVDNENRRIKSENAKQKQLAKKVAALRPGHSSIGSIGTRRKKAAPKKAATKRKSSSSRKRK